MNEEDVINCRPCVQDAEELKQKKEECTKETKPEDHAKTVAPFIHLSKTVNDAPDSLEIGTPSKGGTIKVYGDFNKPEEFKKKIVSALEVRHYANAQINVQLE